MKVINDGNGGTNIVLDHIAIPNNQMIGENHLITMNVASTDVSGFQELVEAGKQAVGSFKKLFNL